MKPMHGLLTASTLSTLAIFISLPLFGLYAADHYQLPASEIGVLMAIWPATVFCLSFFCGIASDRLGYLVAIRIAFTLNALGFIAMAFSQNVIQFGLGMFMFGVGKSFFDSSMRAAIANACEVHEQEKYFRLRYMLQNTACVVGPLIGVLAYKYFSGFAFAVSALVFLSGLGITAIAMRVSNLRAVAKSADRISWPERFKVLHDRNLLLFIISGILILMAYGCYEAMMPVIVTRSEGARPDFGYLVSINAIAVILFQLVHLRWLEGTSLRASMISGFILLIGGFLLFSVESYAFAATIIATIVFSIGEAVLFPCYEVLLNRTAPATERAAYFGAGELKQVGFFIGPLLGGILLEQGGAAIMFAGCAGSLVLASLFTMKIGRS